MQKFDTEQRDDWIFWNEVAAIVESSQLSEKDKENCFMIVYDYLTGLMEKGAKYWKARRDTEHEGHSNYKLVEQEYCFREGSQLGLYWKSLINEQKAFRLKKVVRWLDIFCKEIVPHMEFIMQTYQEDDWEESIEMLSKNTNKHYIQLEKCLEYLKEETERLIAIREERFEEKRKNII